MLEWDDLRHFLAIARHRTLTGAAHALGVQQSTMGRRLEAIELRAGARLLEKTPSGFVLTASGEAILANVERIEAEALAIERAITGKDVKLDGTVRLTAVETLTVVMLTPIVTAFRAKYPGIVIDLVTDMRPLSLTKREADIALRLFRFTQHDLAVRKVAEFSTAIYASRSYLDRRGMPDFAAGAPGHDVLQLNEEQMASPEMTWFAGITGQAKPALRANSRYALRAAAETGMGLVCLPCYLGASPELIPLATPTVAPVRELWMGVHNDIRHAPRIRAVTEFIAAGLKQQMPLTTKAEASFACVAPANRHIRELAIASPALFVDA